MDDVDSQFFFQKFLQKHIMLKNFTSNILPQNRRKLVCPFYQAEAHTVQHHETEVEIPLEYL
jgi:hypothetical protein